MHDLKGFLVALQVGGVMIYPLLALTVLAIVIILEKSFVYSARTRLPGALIALVETYGFAWDDFETQRAPPGGSSHGPPTRRARSRRR